MKVLQINVSHNIGSTGTIAEDIGRLIIQNGGDSYIAYGRTCCATGALSHSYKVGDKFDVYCHVVKTRLFDAHGLGSRRATKKMVKWMQEIAPDIIHLHNIHGYYLHYPTLFQFLREYSVPVVWTLHDCWTFTGHCAHFESVGCGLWQEHCHHCPNRYAYPKSVFLDMSHRNYKYKKKEFTSLKQNLTLVPVSNWLNELLNHSFFSGDVNVQVIRNGVDLSIFKPSFVTISDFPFLQSLNKQRFYLSISNKGLSDIIEFSSNYLNDEEAIIVVGLKEKELKKIKKNKRIVGLKRINGAKEMSKIYNLCDAYLNFSYGDTYPTTNLESIASGTPVITYKTGGCPESVTENTGFVVEKRDFLSVRSALNIISNNKKNYSQNCRQYALRFFDKEKQLKDYITLYKRLLARDKE